MLRNRTLVRQGRTGQDRDREQAVVFSAHCFQQFSFFVPSISASPCTSIGSLSTACSAIIAPFYISTFLTQGWLFVLFCPFLLHPWEICLQLRAICHLLQTSPFCNSSVTLTSAGDWAEIKQGLNVSEAGPIRQENNKKSLFGFHWRKNLIWVYIPLAFWGLFPGQNRLGLCLSALWKEGLPWRPYPSSIEEHK